MEYIENIQRKKRIIIALIIITIIVLIGSIIFFVTHRKNIKDLSKNLRNGRQVTINEIKTTNLNGSTSSYFSENLEEDDEVIDKKTFTCKTTDCQVEDVTKNYAFVLENNGFYIYNYPKNELVYGPLAEDEVEEFQYTAKLIEYDDKLYAAGVSYYDDSENYETALYNAKDGNSYENIKGSMYDFTDDINVTAKYNYIVLKDDEKINFFNLKTGKIDYNYQDGYMDVIDTKKDAYIVSSNKIYNLNKQEVFKENEVALAKFINNQFIISKINGSKRQIVIYDKNKKFVKKSPNYDNVLMIGENFIVVNNNQKLQLVDFNFNVLTTFMTNYEEILKDNPNLTKEDLENASDGYGYEFYYIPSTKKSLKKAIYIGGYGKPILYLYPKVETKVTVRFENPSKLTTTYPKYQNKWEVIAKPNGDLNLNGRYYYGLYWEEKASHYIDFNEGFYVESKDAIKFLEEKLAEIGFNERESNEFIMYWLPILEKNQKSLVYFELTEERDKYSKLLITPKPDSLLRVAIHVKKVNEKVNIKKQQLKKFKRKGFTALEWGGVIHE